MKINIDRYKKEFWGKFFDQFDVSKYRMYDNVKIHDNATLHELIILCFFRREAR